jgi:hypothetical protein
MCRMVLMAHGWVFKESHCEWISAGWLHLPTFFLV